MIANATPLTYTAYKYFGCTYLFCEEDRVLGVGLQERMVRENMGRGKKGRIGGEYDGEGHKGEVDEVRCDAGHSPFLSQVEIVVGVVEGIVRKLG